MIELKDLFWVKEKSTICVAGTTNTVPIEYFYSNLNTFTLKRLEPVAIIVYGTAPRIIFDKYEAAGIKVICFSSDYAISHKEVV